MPVTPNYYDLLNIPKDAGAEEIRHAYHELARLLHPDKNPNKGATDQFLNLQIAYETLIDPARRAAYDKKLRKESDDPILVEVSYSRQRLTFQPGEPADLCIAGDHRRPQADRTLEPSHEPVPGAGPFHFDARRPHGYGKIGRHRIDPPDHPRRHPLDRRLQRPRRSAGKGR